MKNKQFRKKGILNIMPKFIKQSILIILVLVTPVLVFAEQDEVYDDIDETMEVGKGLEIMPNHEGSEFEIVEVEKEKEEPETPAMAPRISLFAAPSGGPHFGNFKGKSGTTVNLYKNASDSSAYTYIEPTAASSGVVPILDQTTSMYKIAIAGFEGWISKTSLDLVPYDSAKGNDYYQVNNNGDLIHYISRGTGSTSYSVINQGKGPSYLDSKKKYISYDGHYFYDDSKSGLTKLIADYNGNTRKQSVNSNNPFYNYFQYLPARTQSKLTASDFKRYLLTSSSSYSNPFNSALAETEQLFIDNGNIFGGNSSLAFASAVHESGWGTSYFAKGRNNYFGHNAYDSAPGLATTYNSPNTGIKTHFGRFLNWNYIDSNPNNGIYYGGFVGNKNMGMNVKYASDPYWGEKIAAHYYNMDKLAGGKDYKLYTIGLTKSSNRNVYKEASSTSGSPYPLKHAGMPIAVTKEVKSGSITWLQHTSEAILNSKKDREPWASDLSKIYYPINIAKSQLYINSNDVEIISKGSGSTLYTQTTPKVKKEPKFDVKNISVYTLQKVNLYPDWSTDYSSILSIPKDTKLQGVATDNGWMLVQYTVNNDYYYVGYVSLGQVATSKGGKPVENIEIKDPQPDPLPQPGKIKYVVDADAGLRIRKGPSTSDGQIGLIPNKTKLTGGKPLNGWVYVTYKDIEGYVSQDFLKEEKVEPEYKLGDVNDDGRIDGFDMMEIKRHYLGIKKLSGNSLKAADVNGDGKIDGFDMMDVKRDYLGIKKIKG